MEIMIALGLAGIMILLGVLIRAKIRLIGKLLVPASVIGGVLGFVLMNASSYMSVDLGTNGKVFSMIVENVFTISFISISLTSKSGKDKSTSKVIAKGALSMGLIWCLLYAITPMVSYLICSASEGITGMNPVYGVLIQFAFCQGPGQAVTYGTIFEQFGWENAVPVALSMASIGFISAFCIGIPMAKAGIKSGIARHCGTLDESTIRGYLRKCEQTEYMIKDTTVNSNVETLTFHFAIIGLCYIIAVGISKLAALIPGFLGVSLGNMMFMNGMYAAYIVKFVMKKLKVDFLLENTLLGKITGFSADYLVVGAFMAITVDVISGWFLQIILICAIVTIITYLVCRYFGSRIGSDHDFERMLGIYGTCTGTVPSGISLVRIVDPEFKTPTVIELGACNLFMLFCTPVYIILLAFASSNLDIMQTFAALVLCVCIYLVLLKVTKSWNASSF